MPTKTLQSVFNDLVALANTSNGGARGGTLLACDILHQEALYEVQERLSRLLLEVAVEIGPDAQKTLIKKFPYAFKVAE